MGAEWITDIWGWFTTTRVTAISAASAAGVGIQTLRRSRRSSKTQSRPMVGAELELIPHASGMLALVVRNFGTAVACNVRLNFDPPIRVDTSVALKSTLPYLIRRYEKAIPTMMPGTEFSNIYWSKPDDEATGRARRVTVSVQCQSADRNIFGRPDRYSDEFILDVDVLKEHTYVVSSSSPEGQMTKLVEAVRALKP